ncbi:MAG: UDP-N-acetylmuramoyl-L-alanyl-D-glutamate--2,6-diaminopimelate ligase [Patescibacteria group bacterium]|nr:UDP-N-acetylmuramoyl-L-alanyl-D-glutamate--2,6-diaminopimelate ligase [Patescibacteria group bacterium]
MLYKLKSILRRIVPYKFILFTHKIRAFLAAVVYKFPGKKLRVIGVAGTKGKTTTVNMIVKILEESGNKVAMLSTANFQIGDRKWLNDVKLTTTSPFYFQKFLRKAVKEKCNYAVVEISSHGLVQYRHWGVPYHTVVLTNMMSDHLDYHKTYANYKNSHNALFTKNLENIIINYDDENLRSFLDIKVERKCHRCILSLEKICSRIYRAIFCSTAKIPKQVQNDKIKKYVFSLKSYQEIQGLNLVKTEKIILNEKGSEFAIASEDKKENIKLPLIGEFNIYNSLAAASVGLAEGTDLETIKKALESTRSIPGRLEKINEGQDFEVIVDYAHSPDSLKSVYETVKPYVKNRLIAVLGGTGDRDKTYRAEGGALADEYADIVIITNEDPYSEDPEKIIDQVMSGVKNKTLGENWFRISDRKEAIKKAVSLAKSGDLILITGKGSEQLMICGEQKIPWDDREIAREAIRRIE